MMSMATCSAIPVGRARVALVRLKYAPTSGVYTGIQQVGRAIVALVRLKSAVDQRLRLRERRRKSNRRACAIEIPALEGSPPPAVRRKSNRRACAIEI